MIKLSGRVAKLVPAKILKAATNLTLMLVASKLKYIIVTFLSLICLTANAQVNGDTPIGVVGFYNLENLFDTEDDPDIYDEEYMPDSDKAWTLERYQEKLGNMAKVIAAMAGAPDILGVCEVENRKVLEDLVLHPTLIAKRYQIVHFNSPDGRGIDVALLYKPNMFIPFHSENISVKDPEDEGFKTRDILYVKGLFAGDTLNVFVNHWPSRRGGKEDKRILAAQILRNKVDSITAAYAEAKIVIMGDLNDDPRNKSVKKVLNADNKLNKNDPAQLYNPSANTYEKGYGTLFYRGAWNLFDQIIISRSLLKGNSESFHYIDDSFQVFAPTWMQVKEGEYKGAPNRTFVGDVYKNGYSDHYPTFIVLGK